MKMFVFENIKKENSRWTKRAYWKSLRVISDSSIPYLGGFFMWLRKLALSSQNITSIWKNSTMYRPGMPPPNIMVIKKALVICAYLTSNWKSSPLYISS